MNTIVIDTNIFISALIKDGLTRKVIIKSKNTLLFPEFEFIEIKHNIGEILHKSKLSQYEFEELFRSLLKHVKIVENEKISNYAIEAKELMDKINENDSPFIATALATNSVIWSEDKHFKKQNKIKVYTTKEVLSLLQTD